MASKSRKMKEKEEKERKERAKIRHEILTERNEGYKRKKAYRQKIYDEAPDERTPEQIEHSEKTMKEVKEFLEDKYVLSKFGNELYPNIVWRRVKEGFRTPREYIRVVEHEVVKEVVKPNKTYSDYLTERDPVPEEVIINGFKDILEEYGIYHLDDYSCRKLFYHIILSIGHYLDNNPEFFLNMSDIHIYREPLARNIFTVVIPQKSYNEENASVEGLYNYFVGGDMDLEALNKTIDTYALSYIEYTEKRRSLRQKARDSYNRFRLMSEIHEEAKEMLKLQKLNGIKVAKSAKKLREEITARRKLENRSKIRKYREEDEAKGLTIKNNHDIIEENKQLEDKNKKGES